MNDDFLVVIPARMASTRFPGKVLERLGELPVVEWCRRAALAARIGPVWVATDDARVERALKPYGADVLLTSKRCGSGSDRVWEALQKRPLPSGSIRFIMNLQGDEPLISAGTLRSVAAALRRNPRADMATAVVPIRDPRQAANPDIVKVALSAQGRCLYFSRAPIPYPRHGSDSRKNGDRTSGYFRHIGIYAFTRSALKRFVALPASSLEKRESLEQLRALEAGMTIVAAVVQDPAVAIDTPADLHRARVQIGAPHG